MVVHPAQGSRGHAGGTGAMGGLQGLFYQGDGLKVVFLPEAEGVGREARAENLQSHQELKPKSLPRHCSQPILPLGELLLLTGYPKLPGGLLLARCGNSCLPLTQCNGEATAKPDLAPGPKSLHPRSSFSLLAGHFSE